MPDWTIDFLKNPTPWGLFATGIMFLLLGRLLPKSYVDDRIQDYKDRVASLEKALDREKGINDANSETLKKLLTYAESTDRVLDALYNESKKGAS